VAPLPLDGLKVLDFTWVGVGPQTTKYLGDHGATVVRVETVHHLDILRTAPPYANSIPGPDRSAYFANFNRNKYSITINLAHPEGAAVARRLAAWADILAQSFTPGTMDGWGLSYSAVRALNPTIIYFSTSQQGDTGPDARHPGFGSQMVAISGFSHLTGWPDGPPVGPYGAYTDTICPRLAASAILAALDYRRRTGQGQYIDLSQVEASLHFIAPAVLDYTANGRDAGRQGNASPHACPHGAYRCRGDDAWIALSISSDEQWQSMVRALSSPAWANDPRLDTFLGRRRRTQELDRHIESWTLAYTPLQAMEMLQAAGVPAGPAESTKDLHEDPQLAHRRHFWRLEHPEIGPHCYDGFPFRLSLTPGTLARPGPLLGQHTELVCREVLGMSDSEFVELLSTGALE